MTGLRRPPARPCSPARAAPGPPAPRAAPPCPPPPPANAAPRNPTPPPPHAPKKPWVPAPPRPSTYTVPLPYGLPPLATSQFSARFPWGCGPKSLPLVLLAFSKNNFSQNSPLDSFALAGVSFAPSVGRLVSEGMSRSRRRGSIPRSGRCQVSEAVGVCRYARLPRTARVSHVRKRGSRRQVTGFESPPRSQPGAAWHVRG